MNLCSSQHEEICYEGRSCPMCDMMTAKDEEITKLKEEKTNIEEELEDAQARLAAFAEEEPVVTEIRQARKSKHDT